MKNEDQAFENDLIDLIRKYVSQKEMYWRDWNGRAANRAAELEARIEHLEAQINSKHQIEKGA
jgi:hypothetical protein